MSDWADKSVFGWDLPPGVTQRMIDEQVGEEDKGIRVYLNERKDEYFLVRKVDNLIVLEYYQYHRGSGNDEFLDGFAFKRGEAQLLAKAINERL